MIYRSDSQSRHEAGRSFLAAFHDVLDENSNTCLLILDTLTYKLHIQLKPVKSTTFFELCDQYIRSILGATVFAIWREPALSLSTFGAMVLVKRKEPTLRAIFW